MDLVILVPALITTDRQVEMVRVQSLLRDRMRMHVQDKEIRIHSCVVYDHVVHDWLDVVLDLDFSIKLFGCQMYPEGREPTGIRRPVEHAVQALGALFSGHRDVHLLRVIQDTVIDDVGKMGSTLQELSARTRPILAGELQECAEIDEFLAALQIPCRQSYPFVQGALMFARLDVWLEHYPRLPARITHYCDDSVMSQMVVHAGGELVAMPGCWRHCHEATAEEFRQIYDLQSAELNVDARNRL